MRDDNDVLCSGLQSLTLSRRMTEPLEASFKKLCLQEEMGPVRQFEMKTTSKGKLVLGCHDDQDDAKDSDDSEACVKDSSVEDWSLNGKVDGSPVLCLSSLEHTE